MYPAQYVEVSLPAQWMWPIGARSAGPWALSVPGVGIITGQPRLQRSLRQFVSR